MALTPADGLHAFPKLQPDQVKSPDTYRLPKRGNSLRVVAEAVRWASAMRT